MIQIFITGLCLVHYLMRDVCVPVSLFQESRLVQIREAQPSATADLWTSAVCDASPASQSSLWGSL